MAELVQRMGDRPSGIRLAEGIDPETAAEIRRLAISGVDLEPYPYRVYPQGDLFANVVGFLNLERVPQAGLEQSRDRDLQRQPIHLQPVSTVSQSRHPWQRCGRARRVRADGTARAAAQGPRRVPTTREAASNVHDDRLRAPRARGFAAAGSVSTFNDEARHDGDAARVDG